VPPTDLPPPTYRLPDPAQAPRSISMIAATMHIDPATMLAGYGMGLFAMPAPGGLIGWFSPDPRGILPLDGLRVTRSLRKSMKRYSTTVDRAFDEVLAACADRQRPGHWIAPEFERLFQSLHRSGWAHSVEVWDERGVLAGGLFGVEVGGLFSGESMFHRSRDASKVALVALVEQLRSGAGPRLLDVQWATPHLESLGVIEVSRWDYLRRLRAAKDSAPVFG
jgi:leucyl/phenylalanyl-tRNA--protein transferase